MFFIFYKRFKGIIDSKMVVLLTSLFILFANGNQNNKYIKTNTIMNTMKIVTVVVV